MKTSADFPPKFHSGQRVWFLKSMRACTVGKYHGYIPPHGHCYSVEVVDSGKSLFVPEQELELYEGQKAEE